ncbi:protein D2-like [Portunus trituberculatus]|uniref:protein D2-like n=1 Tax=Portunus trituberculatus TaxID=210409 RepID=UPI001E1D0163|nr:protein D2-like [Portunus trituberculatus]
MEQHGVIPDVLPCCPPSIVQARYGNTEVECGTVVTPTEAKDVPQLSWPVEAGALYTLCMTDPDAPSREDPKFGEWQHWLVVNIPGNDVSSGDTLSQYVGPGPPRGTGLHRYVFVVYRQSGRLTCDEPRVPNTSASPRRCFKINKFAEKYNLQLIAGNFFQAKYDSYCDQVHKQLGI